MNETTAGPRPGWSPRTEERDEIAWRVMSALLTGPVQGWLVPLKTGDVEADRAAYRKALIKEAYLWADDFVHATKERSGISQKQKGGR